MNPYHTVFDAKRLIGRKFDDAEVQADIKHFPFKVISKTGKPVIEVEYRGEIKQFVRLFFYSSIPYILISPLDP
jgi:heat shock protein 1/8